MSNSVSGSSHDLLIDLAALDHYTELNNRDSHEARNGYGFDYFIDADIFTFAVAPNLAINEGRSPVALFEQNAVTNEMALPVAAYEVAEYVFSLQLPGQHGHLLYATESHSNEIHNIVGAIIGDPTDLSKDQLGKLVSDYQARLKEVTAEGLEEAEIVDLAQEASNLVIEMFESSLQKHAAILRADKTWRDARPELKYIRAREERTAEAVHEWCVRLACAQAYCHFSSVQKDAHQFDHLNAKQQERLRNDARSILDIIALNKQAGPKQRTVLLTRTGRIHRAYRGWFLRQSADEFYALRHLVQYLPLINLVSYANAFRINVDTAPRESLFANIRNALDTILHPVVVERFRGVLRILDGAEARGTPNSVSVLANLKRQVEWNDVEEDVRELAHLWRLAYANSSLMALPSLQLRFEEHREILSAAVERADGDHLAAQQSIVANIEVDHVSQALTVLAQQAELEHQRLPAELQAEDQVRVVAGVILPLSEGVEDDVISRALSGTVRDALNVLKTFSVTDAAREFSVEKLLASVWLSLALGEWDLAKRIASQWARPERAERLLGVLREQRDNVVLEMGYLYALAVRFDCNTSREFEAAIRNLSHLQSGPHLTHNLRNGRAMLERGTLRSVAALRAMAVERLGHTDQWKDLKGQVDFGVPEFLLERASADFITARDRLALVHGATTSARRLELQLAVNTLCCSNLMKFAGVQSRTFAELAENSYAALKDRSDEFSLKWIAYLNIEAYEVLTGRSKSFPGSKATKYYRLYGDFDKLAELSVTRRFVAGSDKDLLKLYSALLN